MSEDKPTNDQTGEQSPDDAILAHPEWGSVNMLAMAASFGAVVPGAVSAAYDTLFLTMERHGEFSLTNGGGPLDLLTDEQRADLKREEEEAFLDAMIEVAEASREEWARTQHTLGRVTMTGAEWDEFADDLKNDTPMRRWLLEEVMRKENKTQAQAAAEVDEIALLARMQSVPKNQWTEEMKALDRKLAADPELKTKYEGYIEEAQSHRALSYVAQNTAETSVSNSTQTLSVATGADVLDAAPTASVGSDIQTKREDFPTAPVLVDHHTAALAATEPLDSKPAATPPISTPPDAPKTQIAAVSPGAGFDA